MRLRDYLRATISLLLMPALCAQTIAPAQQTVNTRDYTFKVNSDLVLVNVVVRDKKGSLVRGLKQEDFTVLEDNKQQNITSFDFENTDTNALETVTPVTGPSQQTVQSAPTAAPVAVAQPEKKVTPFNNRRLIVLFFDFTGMETEEID